MKSIEEINKEIQKHKEAVANNDKEKIIHSTIISTLEWVKKDKNIDLFKDYNVGL